MTAPTSPASGALPAPEDAHRYDWEASFDNGKTWSKVEKRGNRTATQNAKRLSEMKRADGSPRYLVRPVLRGSLAALASREASPAPLTDAALDDLLDDNGGEWHDGYLYINTSSLVDLLRRAAALASPQAAPAPNRQEIESALHYVDDFIARCNGDDRGSCESVNVLRRALAAPAPVAPTPAEPTETQLLALVVDNPGSFEGGQRAAAINRGRERYAAFVAAAPVQAAPTPAQQSEDAS